MEEKAEGIVISSISYGESDKILNIFTLDKGVISAKIKGVKKSGAKLSFAKEPFCFAEFVFSVKGNYRTVIGASLIDSFYPLRENFNRLYSASVVVEYIKQFLKESIISPELFLLALNSLKNIAYEDGELNALTEFLIKALRLSGYALSLRDDCRCGNKISNTVFFDYRTGSFTCNECRDDNCRQINFLTYKTLLSIEKGEALENEGVIKALRLLDYYIENKTEITLKSLKELIKLSA